MQVPFAHRPTSGQWEPLPIYRVPGLLLWVWYRPQHLPHGLQVRIPPELQVSCPAGFPFTLADVLTATGVEPALVQSFSLFGGPWQSAAGAEILMHQALPGVMPGAAPELVIQVAPAGSMATAAAPVPAVEPVTEPSSETAESGDTDTTADVQKMMYDRIDSAWRSSVQMERQMTGLRQKLASVLNTLNKLDRELHPDERLASERDDRDAWQEARRWLRDLGAKCHREIKNFDIGMTSAAGRRNSIEQMYREIIEPRTPCRQLEDIGREFEAYRKDMMNLQRSMQAALQAASQNGTQRANRVLGVIGRKIRERRARMREPIGGTNMDRSVRRKS